MKTTHKFVVFVLVGLLLGGLLTYTLFPREVKVEVEKNVTVEKLVTVIEYVNVTKLSCPNREEVREPAKAYVIVDGVKTQAGTHYTNTPTECARLHNRSLC